MRLQHLQPKTVAALANELGVSYHQVYAAMNYLLSTGQTICFDQGYVKGVKNEVYLEGQK